MSGLTEQEVLDEALRIAEDIRGGVIGPIEGASRIWVLSSENDRARFEDLRGFIAAASDYGDTPAHRAEYVEDARREAVQFLARHGL